MAEIKLKAYPVSEMQQRKLKEKFRAYSSADLSERAAEEGAWKSDFGTSWYYTRSARAKSSSYVLCVYDDGAPYDIGLTSGTDGGLRVALQIAYNPECDIVKNCKEQTRTAKIWNETLTRVGKVTSTAPIVAYGKNEYVWLNKEECEKGTAKTMELVSVKLLAKTVAFNKKEYNNDFAKAVELQQQCLTVATEKCTEEEKTMLVEVVMSDKDNYNSAKPNLEKEEEKEEKTIDALFDKFAVGEISEEELRTQAKALARELVGNGAKADDIKALTDEFKMNISAYEDAKVAKLAEQEAINSALSEFDKVVDGSKGGK